MGSARRLIVYDGETLRGRILNEPTIFPDEIAAFRPAYRGRPWRILLTDGILDEYQILSERRPQFQLQPALNTLAQECRTTRLDESRLNRFPVILNGFPREHKTYILDAIAGNAEYFVTKRERWLAMSQESASTYGLYIVTPGRLVELER